MPIESNIAPTVKITGDVRILHLPARMRWRASALSVGIAVPFAVLAALIGVKLGWTTGMLPVIAGVLAPQMLEIWSSRHMARRLQASVYGPDPDVAEAALLGEMVEINASAPRLSPLISGRMLSRILAKRLAAAGSSGRVYWLCAPDAPERNLSPLVDPFAPVLLGRGAVVPTSDPSPPPTFSQRLREQWDELSRVFGSRGWRVFIIFGLVSAVLGLAALVVELFVAVLHRQWPRHGAGILVLIGVVAMVALIRLFRPHNCVAVTGGLVFRRSGWRESAWRLRMFVRENSVLVYWRERVVLAVADANGAESVFVPPDLAEIAIRAWLSPLPPPPLETLSDLR